MNDNAEIKLQLCSHLRGGEAFMSIQEILKKITLDKLWIRPEGLPYSFYEIFFHIRVTQRDILDYCIGKEYEEKKWPEDYWPAENTLTDGYLWEKLKEEYFTEKQDLLNYLQRPETNLLTYVGTNTPHTLLREVLLIIEHTAYHSGQLLIILRHLGLHK